MQAEARLKYLFLRPTSIDWRTGGDGWILKGEADN